MYLKIFFIIIILCVFLSVVCHMDISKKEKKNMPTLFNKKTPVCAKTPLYVNK